MRRIPEDKYKKSDLNNFMTEQYQHLNAIESFRLLNVLKKFEDY